MEFYNKAKLRVEDTKLLNLREKNNYDLTAAFRHKNEIRNTLKQELRLDRVGNSTNIDVRRFSLTQRHFGLGWQQ